MSSVINSLLTEKMITIMDSLPDDWMHAIRIAAKPLLSENIIEEKYIDKMINNVIEFGPYINFVEKFAMPHARPNDGSKERGISFRELTNLRFVGSLFYSSLKKEKNWHKHQFYPVKCIVYRSLSNS